MLSLVLSTLLGVSYFIDATEAHLLNKTAVLTPPVIVTVVDFTEDSAQQFSEDVQKALDTGQTILPIVISSYGGSIYAFLQMADVIKSVPIPVATICSGKCMSAGAMLLAMGSDGYRYAAPNSTILIHDAATMMEGKVKDIVNETNEILRLNKLLFTMLARQSHKPADFFTKLLDSKGHIDLFLTPEQAKTYGIVNYVKMPTIKVKVSTQMNLE
jgi:ATP-dependent Clp endopeptidase proteolytic subunit ClpP